MMFSHPWMRKVKVNNIPQFQFLIRLSIMWSRIVMKIINKLDLIQVTLVKGEILWLLIINRMLISLKQHMHYQTTFLLIPQSIRVQFQQLILLSRKHLKRLSWVFWKKTKLRSNLLTR